MNQLLQNCLRPLVVAAAMLAAGTSAIFAAQPAPAAGVFTDLHNMPANHGTRSRSARLADGRILILGGRIQGPNTMVAAATIFDPVTNGFSATGSLNEPRSGATATSLADGRVLVVGGENSVITATAEVYDPGLGSFLYAGSMSVPRYYHDAVRLADGRVLVVGGFYNGSALATAEIFDPTTDTFTVVPNAMTVPRLACRAVLLGDGRVLIVGGYNPGTSYHAQSEIFDPTSNTFSPAGSMTMARVYPDVFKLDNDDVLILGGSDSQNLSLGSAEIYTPSNGLFVATGPMSSERYSPLAAKLQDGRVLVAGGYGLAGESLATADVYDPVTMQFTPTCRLNTGRSYPTGGILPDGRVLVTAGFNNCHGNLVSGEVFDPNIVPAGHFLDLEIMPSNHGTRSRSAGLADGRMLILGGRIQGPNTMVAAATIFDPVSNKFSATGSLNERRSGATATALTDGRVLVTGGENSVITATAEVYDPGLGSFLYVGSMSVPRYYHDAVRLADGRVLVVGGYFNGVALASAEIFNPASNTFTAVSNTMAVPRLACRAVLLDDGRVLITGGYDPSTSSYYVQSEIFDPTSHTFSPAGSMTMARVYPDVVRLDNGRVLIVGGSDSQTLSLSSAEVYNPSNGNFVATGPMSNKRYSPLTAKLLDGRVLVAGGYGFAGESLSSADVFNPLTMQFTPTCGLNTGRSYPTGGALPDGRVLVAAGYNNCFGNLATAEIFEPFATPPSPTTLDLASSSNPSQVGQPVTFTATISASAATGNVAFFDGTSQLGTVALSAGTAAINISALTLGTHSIRAIYAGDDNHLASSNSLNQVVKTTTTVTISLVDSLGGPLSGARAQYYSGGWHDIGFTDSNGVVSTELNPGSYNFSVDYAFGRTTMSQNISINPVVAFQTRRVVTRLLDSEGTPLAGAGTEYYAGAWRNIGTTGPDGSVGIELLPGSYNFSVNYAFSRTTKTQNIAIDTNVVFQTLRVVTRLVDSAGAPLAGAHTEYYAGAWRNIGTTGLDGSVGIELLPGNYNFAVDYAYGRFTKVQNVSLDANIQFATTKVVAKLRDSAGNPLVGARMQYYAGAWRDIGYTDSNGDAEIELLAGNYNFAVDYAFGRNTKTQNIALDSNVVFNTTRVTTRLISSAGSPIAGAKTQYYAGAWRDIGFTDASGEAIVELLGGNYNFSVDYAFGRVTKTQNVSSNATVVFQTGLVHSGTGTCIQYYGGAWRTFTNDMELLAGSWNFKFNDGTPNTVSTIAAGVINNIH